MVRFLQRATKRQRKQNVPSKSLPLISQTTKISIHQKERKWTNLSRDRKGTKLEVASMRNSTKELDIVLTSLLNVAYNILASFLSKRPMSALLANTNAVLCLKNLPLLTFIQILGKTRETKIPAIIKKIRIILHNRQSTQKRQMTRMLQNKTYLHRNKLFQNSGRLLDAGFFRGIVRAK